MISQDKNFLFFSLPRHDDAYTSTPWQLAEQLAIHQSVTFVDHPYTFLEVIRKFRSPEIKKRIKAYFGADHFWKGDVNVLLAPFVWPINFLPAGRIYNTLLKWNERIVARRINRYYGKRKTESIIYVNSFEFYYPTIQKMLRVNIERAIYHCIDPMVKAFTIKHGRQLQRKAADQADLIISTAPALQADFIQQGYSNSYLVPNAANFLLFNAAMNHDLVVHDAVRGIEGNVVGFLGNIERRTDFDLLLNTINTLKDWTLVMAGPVQREYVPAALWNHPRVKFTGPIDHKLAPNILKRFDVTIIPFLSDEVSSSIYPLKLFEYLAAGKPVVSTNFNPEVLQQLNESIYIANTAREFSHQIVKAFEENTEVRVRQRVSTAAINTWKDRAAMFSSYIGQHLTNEDHDLEKQN